MNSIKKHLVGPEASETAIGKNLLITAGVVVFLLILVLLNSWLMQLIHGFIQIIYGGNSNIKTILVLISVIALSLFSFFSLKIKNPLKKHSKKLFIAMILLAVLGFQMGMEETVSFSAELGAHYPISTINADMTNWEATSMFHNHLPKGTIYFTMSMLGLKEQNFDSGQPLYNLHDDKSIYLKFLLIILGILVLGLLHISSKINELEIIGFLAFSGGFIGLITVILDGGVGSTLILPTLLFLSIYFTRSYVKMENETIKDLLPLMITLTLPALFGPLFNIYSFADYLTAPLIAVVGIGYFLLSQGKKNLNEPFNWMCMLALLLFLGPLATVVEDISFGKIVYDFTEEFTKNNIDGTGNGLFIYGLPKEVSKEKVDLIISEYGEILESHKIEWLGYYRIKPFEKFRTNDLEERLKKELNPETYLYVEVQVPIERKNSFVINWLDGENESSILEDDFFGIIIEEQFDSENRTFLKTRSKLNPEWTSLAILTKIRSESKQKIAVSSTA